MKGLQNYFIYMQSVLLLIWYVYHLVYTFTCSLDTDTVLGYFFKLGYR